MAKGVSTERIDQSRSINFPNILDSSINYVHEGVLQIAVDERLDRAGILTPLLKMRQSLEFKSNQIIYLKEQNSTFFKES